MLDQNWSQNRKHEPDVPPQSHLVNARTNEAWYASVTSSDGTGDHVIRGRSYWLSDVFLLSSTSTERAYNEGNSNMNQGTTTNGRNGSENEAFDIDERNESEASNFTMTLAYGYFSISMVVS